MDRARPAHRRDGLSWFAPRLPSGPVFAIGMLSAAALMLSAATCLAGHTALPATSKVLQLVTLLIVGVVVTPYSLGGAVLAVPRLLAIADVRQTHEQTSVP